MYFIDRTAVVLKPTEAFLNWLKSSSDDLPDLTLAQLRSNCNVFLLPQFDEPEQAVAYFDERYEPILAAELAAWAPDEHTKLPELSLETFWAFFELEVHDTVLDLTEGELNPSPVAETTL
ncbi:MAG: hypothetical protein Q4E77_07250 [Conchiformibius sp.]|nr:hypothetical protein [Conchiformibius sp.]